MYTSSLDRGKVSAYLARHLAGFCRPVLAVLEEVGDGVPVLGALLRYGLREQQARLERRFRDDGMRRERGESSCLWCGRGGHSCRCVVPVNVLLECLEVRV